MGSFFRTPPFLKALPDKIILRSDPKFLPKVPSLANRSREVVLPVFHPDPQTEEEQSLHLLDVKRAVLLYLERTNISKGRQLVCDIWLRKRWS